MSDISGMDKQNKYPIQYPVTLKEGGSDSLNCRECPYGQEDFERRIYWYQKTINEQGIPNNIYHYLKPEDATAEFEQFVWCDKVGGKVYCFGHCTDFYEDNGKIHINRSKRKKRNKRERDLKHKKHMKYLAQICPGYLPPTMSIDKDGYCNFNDPVETVYYKKTYRGNHKGSRYKFYKKYANRVVRRYKGEIGNGGNYKKCFDYWWTVD